MPAKLIEPCLSTMRRTSEPCYAALREGALAQLAGGDQEKAIDLAARLVAMAPLDEDHHALVIRAYAAAGDRAAAVSRLRRPFDA